MAKIDREFDGAFERLINDLNLARTAADSSLSAYSHRDRVQAAKAEHTVRQYSSILNVDLASIGHYVIHYGDKDLNAAFSTLKKGADDIYTSNMESAYKNLGQMHGIVGTLRNRLTQLREKTRSDAEKRVVVFR